MTLQNRVWPDGSLRAHPARGTLFGNRGGRLHDDQRRLGTARWRSRQWIVCVLDFKGRQRRVMGPGYTELFFLDEPTALAAGHRPCFECRHAAAMAFAHAFPSPGRSRAPDMDRVLHRQRLGPRRQAAFGDLPVGAMATDGTAIWARHASGALLWRPEGYRPAPAPRGKLALLTPQATCAALNAGYAPVWHPSAPDC
ncbi:MAG: hypothetical protein AAGE76_05055 [Pseudomonadota bacterium]